jgi:hypothetical protein
MSRVYIPITKYLYPNHKIFISQSPNIHIPITKYSYQVDYTIYQHTLYNIITLVYITDWLID